MTNVTRQFINSNDLIFVEFPYNCLRDIERVSDNSIKCSVYNQYQPDYEVGPMTFGEVGRHLAILGSIQLALEYNFEEKCFYLAVGAKIKRNENCDIIEYEDYLNKKFNLFVKTINRDNKTAKVFGAVVYKNQEVFTAEIEYSLVKKKVFDRLFSNHKISKFNNNALEVNPYGGNRKKLPKLDISDNTAVSAPYTVDEMECLGHFPEYPAFPIAIMGNHLLQTIKELVKYEYGEYKSFVYVDNVTLEARRLVFAEETIVFKANIINVINDGNEKIFTVNADACVNDEVVSSGTARLKLLS